VIPERIWHPISKLEFFIGRTRRWAVDVREHLEMLEEDPVRGAGREVGARWRI
jgi:hypothetical protein